MPFSAERHKSDRSDRGFTWARLKLMVSVSAMKTTLFLPHTVIAVLALGMAGGCTTTETNRRAAAAQADNAYLQEQNRQIKGRLTDMEQQMDLLQSSLDQLRRQAGAGETAAGQLQHLEDRMTTLEDARARDRKAIVDEISAKMAKLIKSSTASSGGSRPRTSEYGREHVVQTGQTLSEIARAYGVSQKAIIDANRLQNPDNLKVNQKIFIPD